MKPYNTTLNAAELDRVEQCLGAAVFRSDKPDKGSSAAWWGIMLHRYLEYLKTKGRGEALKYVYAKFQRGRRTCEAITEDMLPAGDAERAIAHQPGRRTARLVKYPDFGDVNLEIFGGKADVLDISDRDPIIYDYKCGPGPYPARTSQLLGLGAAFSDWLEQHRGGTTGGATLVALGVASSGVITPYRHEASKQELDDWRGRAAELHLKVLNARAAHSIDAEMPEFRKGEHCRWCHLNGECPETRP